MFIDPIMRYKEKDGVFRAFLNIVDHGNDVLHMVSVLD
jgi:hypothetical protein